MVSMVAAGWEAVRRRSKMEEMSKESKIKRKIYLAFSCYST